MLQFKSKSSQNAAESASNYSPAKSIGLVDNRSRSIIQKRQSNALIAKSLTSNQVQSPNATIQLMSVENANKSIENEELVWYKQGKSFQKVRIAKKVEAADSKVEIYLMDGTAQIVELSALQAKKKGESLGLQVAPKGMALPGPSKPIKGERVINRGEVDTELINGVHHVRVYTAIMGSIDFLKEDVETGIATSSTINKMARPFSETKEWPQQDIDDLLASNPKLDPVYERYKQAIGQIKSLENDIKLYNNEQEELVAFVNAKRAEWPLKSRNPSQKAEVKSKERRKDKINQLIKSCELKIEKEKKKFVDARKELGMDIKIMPKDIHQNKNGKIIISTGGNSVLWAGMGTPLRALKWSEKYFAQILSDKPSLKPVYEKYKVAVSQLEVLQEELQLHLQKLAGPKAAIQSKNKAWSSKKITKNQQKSLVLEGKKIEKIDELIGAVKIKIRKEERIIEETRKLLGKDANPLIRSFLIPFASYEKISKKAIPEELNKLAVEAEEAIVEWDRVKDKPRQELQAVEAEVDRYTGLKLEYQIKELKCTQEVKRIDQLKFPNKRLVKRKNLNQKQANDAKKLKLHYNDLLKVAMAKKTGLETQVNKLEKPIFALAKRAMSEVDISNMGVAKVIDEIKKRDFITKSINVDRHDEANQFGVKNEDIDLLRQDAVPGSLITYARYPEEMSRERKSESGEVQSTRVLRDKLGVPQKDLTSSPWLSGGHFAETSKLESNADKLAMYYSTWLKSKDPKFNEEPFLAKSQLKIPLSVREKMLTDFLQENGVAENKKDEYMEKVLAPWASQNMIAHILSSDYDRMNKDQNMTEKGESQNFEKMRYDLPLRRNRMKKTGQNLTLKIAANAEPKELLDILISDFPELKQRYEKISAKNESFTFYDHAQMVYHQFQEITKDQNGDRLISKALVGKMILFHDMEKWNSKDQYGHEGEHKLTIDEMKNYKELWENAKEAKIAQALVNSDPFGEYMKGKIKADEAQRQIIEIAEKLGFSPEQFEQFFKEYHQFFQSDFSSYTDKTGYTSMDGEKKQGKPVFNKNFEISASKSEILKGSDGRFLYSEVYEEKFSILERLFKSGK